jgi:hypothetical protein
MRGRIPVVCLLLGALWSLATAAGRAAAFDQSHAILSGLLERHVHDGLVDYADLQAGRPRLETYLASLGNLTDAEYRGFTNEQQLALLIDAYNAFTLELILRQYPVTSIQDVPQAWDRTIWKLAGHRASKIFEWYREDIVAVWGRTPVPKNGEHTRVRRAVIGFAEEYMSPEPARYLSTHPVAVSYFTFDWSLNEAPPAQRE